MSTIKKHAPLFLFLFFCSCYGQNGLEPGKSSSIKQQQNSPGYPTPVKPTGKGPGANTHCSLQHKEGKQCFGNTGAGIYHCHAGYLNAGQPLFSKFSILDGCSNNIVCCMVPRNDDRLLHSTNGGVCRHNTRSLACTGTEYAGFLIPGIDAGYMFTPSCSKLSLGENFTPGTLVNRTGNFLFNSSDRLKAGRKEDCVTSCEGKSTGAFAKDGLAIPSTCSMWPGNAGNSCYGSGNAEWYCYHSKPGAGDRSMFSGITKR